MKDSLELRSIFGNVTSNKLLEDSARLKASMDDFDKKIKQDRLYTRVFVGSFILGIAYQIFKRK